MLPDRLVSEYDTEIEQLRAELVTVEDRGSDHRAHEIRAKIRDLQYERDLIPRQGK